MANLSDSLIRQSARYPNKTAFVLAHETTDEVSCDTALTVSQVNYGELLLAAEHWLTVFAINAEQVRVADKRIYNWSERIVAWLGANHSHIPALYIACTYTGRCLALLDLKWNRQTYEVVLSQINPFYLATTSTDINSVASTCFGSIDVAPESSLFLLGFTSGSSGQPKAFVRDQQSWLSTFELSEREFGKPNSVLAPGPLSHGLSFYAMAETLNAGGTFYSLSKFDSKQVWKLLADYSIDTLVVVPTMLQAMLGVADEYFRGHSLKRIVSAGAKLAPQLRAGISKLFPGVLISEYYGASELSFVSVAHSDEHAPADSVGRAFSGVEISIRDADDVPLSVGESGHICVQSTMLASNYYIDGAKQALPTIGGFTTVGDVGYLDADGYLYLLDRLDNMIICGGLNVFPSAVQERINTFSGVQDSIVVGLPDAYWGEIVCAIVQTHHSIPIDLHELQKHCASHLSTYEIPKRFFSIDIWPLTGSGKIARASLLKSILAGDTRSTMTELT